MKDNSREGTPYLDACSKASANASRPSEIMRVASYVAELSERATSTAPVFDGGTGNEGAWAPPQQDGVTQLRMPTILQTKHRNTEHALSHNLPLSNAENWVDILSTLIPKRVSTDDRRQTLTNVEEGDQNGEALHMEKLNAGTMNPLDLLSQLDASENADVRAMMSSDNKLQDFIIPQWALDHMHCAIEIFAHGFHNLVGELTKLAIKHLRRKMTTDDAMMGEFETGNSMLDGDYVYEINDGGPYGTGNMEDQENIEEIGAILTLKTWALMLGHAEQLSLRSGLAPIKVNMTGNGEDIDEVSEKHRPDNDAAEQNNNNFASKPGVLAKVALRLLGLHQQMVESVKKASNELELSEASRKPLVEALKEAREHVQMIEEENKLLVSNRNAAEFERQTAVSIASECKEERSALREEIAKLALLPVKVSELTRRVATSDSITMKCKASLDSMGKKYDNLKSKESKLEKEHFQIQEEHERSKIRQASLERMLNHALEAKEIAVQQRERAEQRLLLASTERNTAENLYTIAETNLCSTREKVASLENSDKEKSVQIRDLEGKLSYYTALAREREIALKAGMEELESCKNERDSIKKEVTFLRRSSTSNYVELAKMEIDFTNKVEKAENRAKEEAEKAKEAERERDESLRKIEKYKMQIEANKESWEKVQKQLMQDLDKARDDLKKYEKSSKDILAEYVENFRIKEEKLIKESSGLQSDLNQSREHEEELKRTISSMEEEAITAYEHSQALLIEQTQAKEMLTADLEDLRMRFEGQIQRTADLAQKLSKEKSALEETSNNLQNLKKQKMELEAKTEDLDTKNTELSSELAIEKESHVISKELLVSDISVMQEQLAESERIVAEAETALVQLSLGIDLQSICPAGITPTSFAHKAIKHLRTPTPQPQRRTMTAEEIRNLACSRLSSAGNKDRSAQIMFINQDDADSYKDGSITPSERPFSETSHPRTAGSSSAYTSQRPSTTYEKSSSDLGPSIADANRVRPYSTQGIISKGSLVDDLSRRIIEAAELAGKPLSELKREKARIQISNMIKHKTSLMKAEQKPVPTDYDKIDVTDMRWVDAMQEKGMSVLEFKMAKDGHFFAEIPVEAGFWRFSADRKMHVSGIQVGFPGLIIPPLAPNTYDDAYSQQIQTNKRQTASSSLSKELKTTKVDTWLKTHTLLRTELGVNRMTIDDAL